MNQHDVDDNDDNTGMFSEGTSRQSQEYWQGQDYGDKYDIHLLHMTAGKYDYLQYHFSS